MFGDLKQHQGYKASGITWMPHIPAHWRTQRLKTVVSEKNVKGFPDEPLLAATQAQGVILKEDYGTRTVEAQKSLETLKLVEVDDFVISLRSFQGGIERAHARGIISPAYTILQARDIGNRDYLALLLKSREFIGALKLTVTGIREGQNIEYPRLSRDLVALPPADEQAAIVKYLGHAQARIDRAIGAKRKLIALLEEQKQAIVHEAVTRGLDPSVPLKDSGIPWLGEIPAHWKVTLLGRLLAGIEQGWSPVAAEGDLEDDQWAVLTLAAIDRGRFRDSAHKPIAKSAKIPMRLELRDGDLLLTRSNTRSRVGDVAIARNPRKRTIFPDLIYRLRFAEQQIGPEFAALVLRSRIGRIQIERDARGSSDTMPKISHALIRGWRVPLPPLQDQVTIVREVDAQLTSSSTAIGSVTREIELLREFRTRLTSDVVTGQVDVREIAATLPELTDDLVASADDEFGDADEPIEWELEFAGADE